MENEIGVAVFGADALIGYGEGDEERFRVGEDALDARTVASHIGNHDNDIGRIERLSVGGRLFELVN